MPGPFALDADLPPSDTPRWSPQRKALVVKAVRSGSISRDDACRRYQLSTDEFLSWQRGAEAHGLAGLSVTRLQLFRAAPARNAAPRKTPAAPAS